MPGFMFSLCGVIKVLSGHDFSSCLRLFLLSAIYDMYVELIFIYLPLRLYYGMG